LVLNLRKVLIPKEGKELEKKNEITRLAIGKPGGIDFSDENWEQWSSVFCNVCKIIIDYSQNVII